MIGVNLSGGEFKASGTVYGKDYIFPSNAEIDYYASKGMDVIRVPFQWERAQPTLNGSLDSTHLARLDAVVSYANSKGISVVLDAHDYGTRSINGVDYQIGVSTNVPGSTLANFWGKMAEHYKGANVMYGIMNEPHFQTAEQWLPTVNATIASIRAAGGAQTVLVPGTHWTGAHS